MFHILKAHRTYEGVPYIGPSCDNARIKRGATYTELCEAISDAIKLHAVNSGIAWKIVEKRTGRLMATIFGPDNIQLHT